MKYKHLPQEGLKLIACVTMLLDHIGASVFPSLLLRIIGRVSFPIYCFLLSEGIRHTRSPRKYLLRLGIGALLSEIPFDLLFYGRLTFGAQNVMLTLFLGAAMLLAFQRTSRTILRLLWIALACVLAELLQTDYASKGILLILLFYMTDRFLICLPGMLLIFLPSGYLRFCGLPVPMGLFTLPALIPISLYSGRKLSHSRAVQWIFYFFYPAHLAALFAIKFLL